MSDLRTQIFDHLTGELDTMLSDAPESVSEAMKAEFRGEAVSQINHVLGALSQSELSDPVGLDRFEYSILRHARLRMRMR